MTQLITAADQCFHKLALYRPGVAKSRNLTHRCIASCQFRFFEQNFTYFTETLGRNKEDSAGQIRFVFLVISLRNAHAADDVTFIISKGEIPFALRDMFTSENSIIYQISNNEFY